jgi:hypothetical protein
MATRCCWPPDSCDGSESPRSPQAHVAQHLHRTGQRRPLHAALDDQRYSDVLGGRQRRQQVELLEDEADVPAAELRLLAAREPAQVLAQHRHQPAGRVEGAGQDGDERRLAAAGRADQQGQLAGANVQVDAAQGADAGVAAAVVLGQPAADDARPGLRGGADGHP